MSEQTWKDTSGEHNHILQIGDRAVLITNDQAERLKVELRKRGIQYSDEPNPELDGMLLNRDEGEA